MTSPLQGGKPEDRKSTEEKLTALYDLLGILLKTLLRIFGKRASDS